MQLFNYDKANCIKKSTIYIILKINTSVIKNFKFKVNTF